VNATYRRFLEKVAANHKGTPEGAQAAAWLAADKASRAAKRVKKEPRRKAEKAACEKERRHRAKVYAEVDARSGGICEHGWPEGPCGRDATEHDHFWGRGKAEETPKNVWHLCAPHHNAKTLNTPSRFHWIYQFRWHCFLNGFHEETAKCDRAIALEQAQHPQVTP